MPFGVLLKPQRLRQESTNASYLEIGPPRTGLTGITVVFGVSGISACSKLKCPLRLCFLSIDNHLAGESYFGADSANVN